MNRLHANMNGAAKPIDNQQPRTVRQLAKNYLGWQDGQSNLATRTKQWYRLHLKSFESVAGDRPADAITQADVDRWFEKCGEGWGDNYRLGCYRALSRLYNWGRKRGAVSRNPIRDMERSHPGLRNRLNSVHPPRLVTAARFKTARG